MGLEKKHGMQYPCCVNLTMLFLSTASASSMVVFRGMMPGSVVDVTWLGLGLGVKVVVGVRVRVGLGES